MSLTKADTKAAAAEIWKKLISGDDDEDLMELLGVDEETYETLKKTMLEEQAIELRTRPPEHTYVQYVLWQQRGVHDLTELIEKQKKRTSPNANAMVAAIKVRGDIYDKIIAKGQEFGVLKKTPDTKLIVGGHFVTDLTSPELRKKVTASISEMDKLMKRYGDTSILDVDPGALHHGPKLLTDSSTLESTVVIEAPPAKDDMLAIVAKPVPTGPKGPQVKGKKFKAAKVTGGSKVLGVKSQAVKEENRKKREPDYSERWGDD